LAGHLLFHVGNPRQLDKGKDDCPIKQTTRRANRGEVECEQILSATVSMGKTAKFMKNLLKMQKIDANGVLIVGAEQKGSTDYEKI